jgi:diadenosine tetraphosphate (Ap4A) HIT family hydrolase
MTLPERLESLVRGESPGEIARMRSGFAVMGDSQYLRGYCLLLAYPAVGRLNDLSGLARTAFLEDMAALGDAVLAATDAVRINYSIYGNLDPFLHAHVFPRYAAEPPEFATIPPMSIPAELRNAPEHAYDPLRHDPLRRAIAAALANVGR